jgi:hypothetical protein
VGQHHRDMTGPFWRNRILIMLWDLNDVIEEDNDEEDRMGWYGLD